MEGQADTLLVLNAPPQLEDDLVDYLSSHEQLTGFTSYAVRGHGQHGYRSIAEQVSGRSQRIQFEMMLPGALALELLAGLRTGVGPGISYWQLPVTGSGHIA
jgi:hypothetical protein